MNKKKPHNQNTNKANQPTKQKKTSTNQTISYISLPNGKFSIALISEFTVLTLTLSLI